MQSPRAWASCHRQWPFLKQAADDDVQDVVGSTVMPFEAPRATYPQGYSTLVTVIASSLRTLESPHFDVENEHGDNHNGRYVCQAGEGLMRRWSAKAAAAIPARCEAASRQWPPVQRRQFEGISIIVIAIPLPFAATWLFPFSTHCSERAAMAFIRPLSLANAGVIRRAAKEHAPVMVKDDDNVIIRGHLETKVTNKKVVEALILG